MRKRPFCRADGCGWKGCFPVRWEAFSSPQRPRGVPPALPWMAHRLGTAVLELLMSLQTLLASLGICASSRMSWGSAAAWRCGLTGSSRSGDVPWGLDGFLPPVRLGWHVVRSAPAKRWGAFCQGLLTALGCLLCVWEPVSSLSPSAFPRL